MHSLHMWYCKDARAAGVVAPRRFRYARGAGRQTVYPPSQRAAESGQSRNGPQSRHSLMQGINNY